MNMINKNIKNNNITIVRNIAYKRIKDMTKDIKEITPELSDHFLQKVDINMKNAINKILNDYKLNIQY
jgi:hypothetical protein